MNNVRIVLIILFYTSFCFATTESNLSRIIIDGYCDEFTADENILSNSSEYPFESSTDSYWGEYNDVKQIKVTWDESYLYLAVEACSWNNNVLLFIDIYDDYGIEDMSKLNAWPRSFKFYNWNPDFFIGTWDTNNIPQFWKVQEGGSMTVDKDFDFSDTIVKFKCEDLLRKNGFEGAANGKHKRALKLTTLGREVTAPMHGYENTEKIKFFNEN